MSASIIMPNKNDILLANKAIGLHPKLSASAKSVAAALLDHFNRKTGRCDPSVERLATMLGINRNTVLRATKELCAMAGPFSKDTHGGRYNTSAYRPNWAWFCAFMERWNMAMKSGENVAKMQPDTLQKCNLLGCKNATQTLRSNPEKNPDKHPALVQQGEKKGRSRAADGGTNADRCDETANAISPVEQLVEHSKYQPSAVQRIARKVVTSEGAKPNRQSFLVHSISGGRSLPKTEQVAEAATRRADKYFRDRPKLWALPDSGELFEQIESAERNCKGSGFGIIADALRVAANGVATIHKRNAPDAMAGGARC